MKTRIIQPDESPEVTTPGQSPPEVPAGGASQCPDDGAATEHGPSAAPGPRPAPPKPAIRRMARGAALTAVAASVAVSACGGGTAVAPVAAIPTSALQRDADALVAAGVPGAVLIVRNAAGSVSLTSGVGDVATKTPIRTGDRFRIASLTKSYVATVALQLVGEGRLRLSDTVERWLPGLVPGAGTITIRQLLNHTSGLADFETDPIVLKPFLSGDLGHRWAPRTLVRIAVSHPPRFAPGAGESYSSTNYLLLGLIIEASSGRSLGAELQRRIFVPLGLHATTFPSSARLPDPHAHGYLATGGRSPATDVSGLSPYPWAAGAIVSTAADVATFYGALLSGRLLRPALLRQMETTHAQAKFDVPGQRYGLGLARYPTSCGPAWGHNGVFPGYLVFAFSSANGDRQAVLAINKDASSLSKPAIARYFGLLNRAYCAAAPQA